MSQRFFLFFLLLGLAFPLGEVTGQTILKGHSDAVSWAVFSSDGTRVLTASYDGTARLWNAKTGGAIRTYGTFGPRMVQAEFTPDERKIVTMSDDPAMRVFDTETGQLLVTIPGTSRIRGMDISPDGALIAGALWDSTVRVWEITTGAEKWVLHGHTQPSLFSVDFSPNGEYLVSAGFDSTAILWNMQTGQLVHRLVGHTGTINEASFSPDGRWILTGGFDGVAIIWDSETGAIVRRLEGHQDRIRTARFDPSGTKITTASFDLTARIWNAQSGQMTGQVALHQMRLRESTFSPNGRFIVTASEDGVAGVADGIDGTGLMPLIGHTDRMFTARFSPDSRSVVTASYDSTARIWDVSSLLSVGIQDESEDLSELSADLLLQSGAILVTLNGPQSENVAIRLMDVGGRVVARGTLPSGQSVAQIPSGYLATGTYLLELKKRERGKTYKVLLHNR